MRQSTAQALLGKASSGTRLRVAILFALLLLVAALDIARADEAAQPARPLTGKKWIDMDYGPYLSATIEAPQPAENIANKGLMIRVGREPEAHVIFDTDLMRYSAGWLGGTINWTNVAYDGGHGTHPSIEGKQVFGTRPRPGWDRNGYFQDPRELPYGPLPKDWAHYRGLYLHGEQVILSYTVGDVDVLETPGIEQKNIERKDSVVAFSRTLQIGRSNRDRMLELVDRPGTELRILSLERLAPDATSDAASGHLAILGRGDDVTAVGIVGGADATKWLATDDGSIRLKILAAATPTKLKLLIWQGPENQLPAFAALIKSSPPLIELTPLTKGGPPRWPQKLTTRGVRGRDDGPLAVDAITAPMKNPWRSWLRFGGFDFFPGGRRAAICTWNGDVWIVDGIDDTLKSITWQRIATGMFQPLGVRIVDGHIYVCCRDQITRLHDLNGDGEIDFYESFNSDHQVTPHFHEFAVGLQTDAEGNFYYAKCARHALDAVVPQHGTLLKVSRDGQRTEIICNGFRAANGVGVGPAGELVTSDQEGHWHPANRINVLKPGGFYGNMWSFHRGPKPTAYDPPLCWLSREVDRSPAEQLWVPDGCWGPLAGAMLSTSYGTGQIFLVPHETVDGVPQGGVVRLPVDFQTGIMRGRFNPADGQLYVCGLFGWAGDKTADGGFFRVRYTGKPLCVPVEFHAAANAVTLVFSEPLDRTQADAIENYNLEQWNFRWTENYGSPHFKPSDPAREGHDPVKLRSATLLDDGRTVVLQIDDLRPVMQMLISYSLAAADGAPVKNDVYATINTLGPALKNLPPAKPQPDVAREQQPEVQTGLVLRLTQNEGDRKSTDARRARLPALFVAAGQAPSSLLAPGPFQAEFSGLIKTPLGGRYQFAAEGSGSVEMAINDRLVWRPSVGDLAHGEPVTVRLNQGYNKIQISYHSPDSGDAMLRMYWSGEDFGREPLPADVLFSPRDEGDLIAATAQRTGRTLFAEHRCAKCHALPASVAGSVNMPEMHSDAPSLAGIGKRLETNWIAQWVLDPRALRPSATMPRLIHSGDQRADRQAACDIVAYLATLRESGEFIKLETTDDLIAKGEVLFENLGCIACHSFKEPAAKDSFDRLSLHHVKQEFRPGALADFLCAPQAHYAWSRMPDFHLDVAEAASLATYLQARSGWELADLPVAQGDARRGEKLFEQTGCGHCHATKSEGAPQPPALGVIAQGAETRGCLAENRTTRANVPDLAFTASQREALQSFLRTDCASLAHDTPAEFAARQIGSLQCAACHRRDADGSRLPQVLDQEGTQGHPSELLPSLTWAGEQLQPSWMQRLLAGKLEHRSRSWLKARMPSFGSRADMLSAALAAEHGHAPIDEPRPPIDSKSAEIGGQLIGVAEGFKCTSCHAVGNQPAVAAFEAPGINLTDASVRLRHDYFTRWMLDPLRVDPATKMPRFSTDRRTTSVAQPLDADADRQFEAIWQHLHSLP